MNCSLNILNLVKSACREFFHYRLCFATHRLRNTTRYITNDNQIFFVPSISSYYYVELITTLFPEPFYSCKLDLL